MEILFSYSSYFSILQIEIKFKFDLSNYEITCNFIKKLTMEKTTKTLRIIDEKNQIMGEYFQLNNRAIIEDIAKNLQDLRIRMNR